VDRRVLRKDGNAALALEVVGVHEPLADVAVRAQAAGLPQQLINQRRLSVIDVRDDRDISYVIGESGHAAPDPGSREPRGERETKVVDRRKVSRDDRARNSGASPPRHLPPASLYRHPDVFFPV
jgi:hypothetical protein